MSDQYRLNADGTISLSPGEWWCEQCGRVSQLDDWERCEHCAATDLAEARRLSAIIAEAIDPDPSGLLNQLANPQHVADLLNDALSDFDPTSGRHQPGERF